MDHIDEYNKTCPYCSKEFKANHLSRVYCDETCKKRMFRKNQQIKRERKNVDQEALELNDFALDNLFVRKKTVYSKEDIEEVKFNPNCYVRKFEIDNYIIYFIKDYLLLELPGRVFKIYKYF